jgi:SPP1 family predicted phage head-tail adaptor
MISAGLMNKRITIEHLVIERDDYGSDIEKWCKLIRVTAHVTGADSSSLINLGEEILIQDRLVFTIRYLHLIKFDLVNHYRIIFNNKIYTILNINDTERDTMKIVAILKNT